MNLDYYLIAQMSKTACKKSNLACKEALPIHYVCVSSFFIHTWAMTALLTLLQTSRL